MANLHFCTMQICKIISKPIFKIETTSDNFIHKYLCINYNVLNFSVLPFPISQYTHRSKINKFTSNIDKEGDNIYFINKAENQNEYEKILNNWKN